MANDQINKLDKGAEEEAGNEQDILSQVITILLMEVDLFLVFPTDQTTRLSTQQGQGHQNKGEKRI